VNTTTIGLLRSWHWSAEELLASDLTSYRMLPIKSGMSATTATRPVMSFAFLLLLSPSGLERKPTYPSPDFHNPNFHHLGNPTPTVAHALSFPLLSNKLLNVNVFLFCYLPSVGKVSPPTAPQDLTTKEST
jgi:hypothetical protein